MEKGKGHAHLPHPLHGLSAVDVFREAQLRGEHRAEAHRMARSVIHSHTQASANIQAELPAVEG